MRHRSRPVLSAIAALALAVAGLVPALSAPAAQAAPATYSNPLPLDLGGGHLAEQCADPDVIRSHDPADPAWYLYCTRDVIDSSLRNPDGSLVFSSIPTYRSTDLVHWSFVGEALPTRPAWIGDGDMWAPDVAYVGGRYLLYYTATNTVTPGGGSAIGVATSDSPAGPWTDSGGPVVEPMPSPGSADPNDRRWVFDPELLTVGGENYLYFGSYYGGLSVRRLSADGLHSDPASQVEVAISNRYEGTHVIEHDGWYYLLGSATNCCAGPLTGYGVFAGRSTSPTGPFVDRTGASLLDGRVGGTPVLHQNGNRWIGTGHVTSTVDAAGQRWMLYHAVDRTDPYVAGAGTYAKRPVLMDRLDWKDGWPVVRGGAGPSDSPQPAPVVTAGGASTPPEFVGMPERGSLLPQYSDDFHGHAMDPAWTWTRDPGADTRSVAGDALYWQTQAADLGPDPGAAGLPLRALPSGDYTVEARVSSTVPAGGCCQNYAQGGLVVYQDDANFVKLTVTSIWETRQTEFGKRETAEGPGYPTYGNAVGGPVGQWTVLRLARTHTATENVYTAWTSNDEGRSWDEAGVWTTPMSAEPPRLGLVSMAAAGFTSIFDYVHVYAQQPRGGGGGAGGAGVAGGDAALLPTVELAATGAAWWTAWLTALAVTAAGAAAALLARGLRSRRADRAGG